MTQIKAKPTTRNQQNRGESSYQQLGRSNTQEPAAEYAYETFKIRWAEKGPTITAWTGVMGWERRKQAKCQHSLLCAPTVDAVWGAAYCSYCKPSTRAKVNTSSIVNVSHFFLLVVSGHVFCHSKQKLTDITSAGEKEVAQGSIKGRRKNDFSVFIDLNVWEWTWQYLFWCSAVSKDLFTLSLCVWVFGMHVHMCTTLFCLWRSAEGAIPWSYR